MDSRSDSASSSTDRRQAAVRRVAIFGVVVGALFILAQFVDVATYVDDVRARLAEFGVWGPVVFVLAYALATAVGVPGTPLTIMCALVFDTLTAFVTMTAGTTLAATLGFFTSRYLARDAVERLLDGRKRIQRLRENVVRTPVLTILGMRLMPAFPFAVVNYSLGLSRISYWKYIGISQLAMVPMNLLWIFSADAVYRAVIRGEMAWGIVAVTGGLALVMFGLVHVVRTRVENQEGAR